MKGTLRRNKLHI